LIDKKSKTTIQVAKRSIGIVQQYICSCIRSKSVFFSLSRKRDCQQIK
ncbi:MAG: hypothetical protein ACI9IZ_001974, partial [Nonlabens sp.]